jgi:hypothetical protein
MKIPELRAGSACPFCHAREFVKRTPHASTDTLIFTAIDVGIHVGLSQPLDEKWHSDCLEWVNSRFGPNGPIIVKMPEPPKESN